MEKKICGEGIDRRKQKIGAGREVDTQACEDSSIIDSKNDC
jgi:hypothetical protein